MEGARRPDLLTADHVAPVNSLGTGLDLGRVRPHGRLGDPERLQPELAGGDCRQEALLLLLASVAEQRAHDVHLRMAGAGVAAGGVDLLEDDARRREPEAGAAVLLRDERREPAVLGQGGDELLRIAVGLELPPVLAREAGAELADGGRISVELGLAQRSPSAPDNTHTRDFFKPPSAHLPRGPGHNERALAKAPSSPRTMVIRRPRGRRRRRRAKNDEARERAARALIGRATGGHRRSPSASTG